MKNKTILGQQNLPASFSPMASLEKLEARFVVSFTTQPRMYSFLPQYSREEGLSLLAPNPRADTHLSLAGATERGSGLGGFFC